MNTDSLFKRFDELADAPERIPALRKVILAFLLHSAVGSPDAAARATKLREVHEKRTNELGKGSSERRISGAQIVADEDLPPSLSDIPTTLFARLGDVASIEKGLSQIQSTKPGKYPLVVTAETRSSSESFEFEGAAAIVPLVSSTGHGDASLKRLHYQEGRYAVGNILAVVRPIHPELLRARFIFEYLSAFKEELLVSRMSGTANVSLTVNKLKEVPVPLVSGSVLSRIDELMALCDRLEAQQQERETRHAALARASLARFAAAPTVSNLKFLFSDSFPIAPADLRKSILTLAVQGKLVPQDPKDTAVEDSIKNARRSAGLAARALADFSVEDPPFEVPASWRWVTVSDVADTRLGKMLDKVKNRGEAHPYLRNTNVHWFCFELDSIKTMLFETDELDEYRVEIGDVLICEGGHGIARSAVWEGQIPGVMFQKALHRVRPLSCLNGHFLSFCLWVFERNGILQRYYTGAGIPHFTGKALARVTFPLPPLAEQRRIVAKVEQLMALVDALEQQLAASRATAEKLLTALVAELTSAHTPMPRALMAAEEPAPYGN